MPYKFDAAKLTKDHKIVAVATLVLFISLFLPWFGVGGYLGVGFSFTVDGLWHGYMYLTLILCLAVLGLLALVAGLNELPFKLPIPEAQAIVVVTSLNALLTVISFLTKPERHLVEIWCLRRTDRSTHRCGTEGAPRACGATCQQGHDDRQLTVSSRRQSATSARAAIDNATRANLRVALSRHMTGGQRGLLDGTERPLALGREPLGTFPRA